jgi:WD40 repeat protein
MRNLARKIENWFYKPLLSKLGYHSLAETTHGLPRSNYYQNLSNLKILKEIHFNFLKSTGWLESKNNNLSMRGGKFIPWITYPALNVIEKWNLRDIKILEFGAGASTLYFSELCNDLISYEFDSEYFSAVYPVVDPAVRLINVFDLEIHKEKRLNLDPEWIQLLSIDFESIPEGPLLKAQIDFESLSFHINSSLQDCKLVFIDGGPRNFLTAVCGDLLGPGGVIVLDNTDMPYLAPAREFLRNRGFTEIEFRGLGPLNPYESTTSIFCRTISDYDQF